MPFQRQPVDKHCEVCGRSRNLRLCSRCKAFMYCSREHQAADFATHKPVCREIASCKALFDREEEALRHLPGEPGNIFDEGVGFFGSIPEADDYLQARVRYVDALSMAATRVSVEAQLEHLMDMLRLCRRDKMGSRFSVPSTMLRLGKDQECYDFVQWYAGAKLTHNQFYNPREPYLGVRNCDPFESVDFLCKWHHEINHLICIILLKIRLLQDLQLLQKSAIIGEKVPAEILDQIRMYLPQSTVTLKNKEAMDRLDQREAIATLRGQIKTLYEMIKGLNEHLWPGMLTAEMHVHGPPSSFIPGTVGEMELMVRLTYQSWNETPGAMQIIANLFNVDPFYQQELNRYE